MEFGRTNGERPYDNDEIYAYDDYVCGIKIRLNEEGSVNLISLGKEQFNVFLDGLIKLGRQKGFIEPETVSRERTGSQYIVFIGDYMLANTFEEADMIAKTVARKRNESAAYTLLPLYDGGDIPVITQKLIGDSLKPVDLVDFTGEDY